MKRYFGFIYIYFLTSLSLWAHEGYSTWNYSGPSGPLNWHILCPEYKICKEGYNQSPINISGNYAVATYPILPQISEHYLILENTGKGLRISYNNDSIFEAFGVTYTLEEIIFHTPSEHQLDGQSKAIEAQFIHKDGRGNQAIISVLFDKGEENTFLKTIERYYPEQPDGAHSYQDVKLNAKELLPLNKSYTYYRGSLTTPPCTESINWFILSTTLSASEAQIKKLQALLGSNNRPIQSLKERILIKGENKKG